MGKITREWQEIKVEEGGKGEGDDGGREGEATEGRGDDGGNGGEGDWRKRRIRRRD